MKTINRDNYEAFLLDYLEGNLTGDLTAELQSFLSEYPELKASVIPEIIPVPSDPVAYKHKELLQRLNFTCDINDQNVEDFIIAYYEMLLPPEKKTEVLSFCSGNSTYGQLLETFQKTYVKPDTAIRYPHKKLLRHKKKTVFSLLYTVRNVSIAASIALFLAFSLFMYFRGEPKKTLPGTKGNSVAVQSSVPLLPSVSSSQIIQKKNIRERKGTPKHTFGKLQPVTTLIEKKQGLEKSMDTLALLSSQGLHPIQIQENFRLADIRIQSETEQATDGKVQDNPLSAIQRLTESTLARITNKKGKLSALKILKAGINEINDFTDLGIRLKEKTDSMGNVTAFSVESDQVEFHRSKRN